MTRVDPPADEEPFTPSGWLRFGEAVLRPWHVAGLVRLPRDAARGTEARVLVLLPGGGTVVEQFGTRSDSDQLAEARRAEVAMIVEQARDDGAGVPVDESERVRDDGTVDTGPRPAPRIVRNGG